MALVLFGDSLQHGAQCLRRPGDAKEVHQRQRFGQAGHVSSEKVLHGQVGMVGVY
jgi:hypothetical protein